MTKLYSAGEQMAFLAGAKAPSESHANRGMDFERELTLTHDAYRLQGRAEISKNYVRSTVVKGGQWARVDGAAIVDYSGTMRGGRFVAFDAKDSAEQRIALDRLQDHQRAFLLRVAALGGSAFVLARFERRTVYAIPVVCWAAAVRAHVRGERVAGPCGFTPSGMASIHMDELPEAWRVNNYDWLTTVEGGARK